VLIGAVVHSSGRANQRNLRNRDEGVGSTRDGQAVPNDELRARVVIWLPSRLARLRCERGSVVVVWPVGSRIFAIRETQMRVIGLDVHRSFAEVAILENGTIKHAGRLKLEHQRVVAFGKALKRSDEVVLEATGNTGVIVRLLMPFVRRVVVANPLQVRSIAWAKVKTDKIDAALLAKLHASGFLPEVWVPNEETDSLRRRIAERNQLVSQMTRLKNRVQSVLHANLIPRYAGKLFSKRGRTWLDTQPLPEDQRRLIVRHLDEHDRIAVELAAHEKSLAEDALGDKRVKRLMTIGGVNAIVALGVLAAIGDVARFSSPQKLVSYFGLNPKVRQSGDRPAYHGRISRQGRAHARAMLVEAAWSIATQPGPLRAFFARIKQRRGQQIAAVATARKLAVLIWHLLTKEEDYAWTRPALMQWKLRQLELRAGRASRRGGNKPGPARDYSLKTARDKEREWLGLAESDYRRFVSAWKEKPPARRPGAAKEVRRS
jgi:transposase